MRILGTGLALAALFLPGVLFAQNPSFNNDGWTLVWDGAEAFMSRESLGEIRMESIFALNSARVPEYMKEVSLVHGCASGIAEGGSELSGCGEWEIVEVLKDAHYQGIGAWYRVFFYHPTKSGALPLMRFTARSIVGRDPVSPEILETHFPEWTVLSYDTDNMTYTYAHKETGAVVTFEKTGLYLNGDTIESVTDRMQNLYHCGNVVPAGRLPAPKGAKKPEHPYTGGVKMHCPDHTAVYVFKNDGTVIYDFVVRADSHEAEQAGISFILKTEELNPLM